MPFDFAVLEDLLICPKSKSELVLDGDSLVSVDPACRLRYAIRDGIPIMLVDEARPLDEDDAIPEEVRAEARGQDRTDQAGG
jgi:uncharacterized protein